MRTSMRLPVSRSMSKIWSRRLDSSTLATRTLHTISTRCTRSLPNRVITRRSASPAVLSGMRTSPPPAQCGHSAKCALRTLGRMRWRVSSTKPNSLMRATVVLARSFRRFCWKRSSISRRWRGLRMSMRSHTTRPPMSRRRSWRQISSTASLLVSKAFVSLSRALRLLPLFTSMATSASVWSNTSAPPDGSGTVRW